MRRAISGDAIIAYEAERDDKLLIEPYFAEGETMMLYAPTGQGKTINALMLSIALTTGTEFYGTKAKKAVPVLFVEGGELQGGGIAQRARAIYKRLGVTSDPNFHLEAPTKERNFTYNITKPEHQEVLENYIDHFGIKVVVFDNYNSLRSEQDNEFLSWHKLEKFLNRLKTKDVATVIVHHTNKEGQRQSGAQRKEDFCDAVIRIQKAPFSTRKKMFVEFVMEKFRWGQEIEPQLTHITFKDDRIRLIPLDYEKTFSDMVKQDIKKYGTGYVKQKYPNLGFKIAHYLEASKRESLEDYI